MTTIRDVAKKANVSTGTVSHAFNKSHLVKPETLARIWQAVDELDYTPNLSAQALKRGKTQIVGLLVSDIRYPYTAAMARGIEDVLAEAGYISVIASTDGNQAKTIQLSCQLHRRGAGGFILIPSHFGISLELLQAIKDLIEQGISVVLGGYQVDDPMVDFVTYHPQAGTRVAVDHLINLGHCNIAYLGSRHSQGHAVAHWLGYQESLLTNQIPLRPELVIETDVVPAQVKQAMTGLINLALPPTAIFALNDVVTMAIIDFCHEQNIHIPEQLSLVSFDYLTLPQRTIPGVTSIVVPTYEVGQKAAEIFLHRQQNPDLPPQQVAIDYHFEIRQTTAPP